MTMDATTKQSTSSNVGTAFPLPRMVYENHIDPPQVVRESAGMTLRAYAAMKLLVADSGIDWLDAMIEKARIDNFAGQALVGLACEFDASTHAVCAEWSYNIAAAMLAEKAKREAKP
jgi:hypothetical protein